MKTMMPVILLLVIIGMIGASVRVFEDHQVDLLGAKIDRLLEDLTVLESSIKPVRS